MSLLVLGACTFRKLRTNTPHRRPSSIGLHCPVMFVKPRPANSPHIGPEAFCRNPLFLRCGQGRPWNEAFRISSQPLPMLRKQEERPGVALAVGKNIQPLQSQPWHAGQQETGEATLNIVKGAHLPPPPACGRVRATETVTCSIGCKAAERLLT